MQTARRFESINWTREIDADEPLIVKKSDVFDLNAEGLIKRGLAGYRALTARDAQNCRIEGNALVSPNGCWSTRWVGWYPTRNALIVEGSDSELTEFGVDQWVAEGLNLKFEEVELWHELSEIHASSGTDVFVREGQIWRPHAQRWEPERTLWRAESQTWGCYTHRWFVPVDDGEAPAIG